MMNNETYFTQLQTAPIARGLHYWEKGSGPTLLFLHGALSNGFTFRKILPELSLNFHCITLHLPLGGHQIPVGKTNSLSPSGITALIRDFLHYKGINQVTIFANDTGGAYAQIFTARYPDVVASLVLSNCEVMDVFPPPKFAYLRYAVRILGFTSLMGKLFSIKSLLTHPAVMGTLSLHLTCDEIAAGYLHPFVHNREIRKDFARVCRHWHPKHTMEAARLLNDFDKPVLVLWGDRDEKLFPRKQMEKLLTVFPHATWETINNAKTYIQEDAPEQTIKAIQLFLLKGFPL